MVKNHLFSKSLLLLIAFVSSSIVGLYAQSGVVSGVVKDDAGYALPGVVVQIVGNATYGVVTGIDGDFTVQLDGTKEPELQFSYVGMVTQTIPVQSAQSNIQIVMENDATSIEEVVVVGFGEQKRVSITGSVTSVKTDDLPSSASSSLATSLTGRMPGTVIVQNSGEAGSAASNISIRGSSNEPLILVDGIERDFEDLDMDEVESISILKDASATAVYGIRGGDGVIIVTTKRGKEGKFKVNFKTELSLTQRGQTIEPLNSAEFTMLMNEARRNDNGISLTATADNTGLVEGTTYTDVYTPDQLSLYQSGLSDLYPDTDWFDVLYNDFGHRERYSVSVSGGNEFFTTYTSLSYMYERDCYANYDTEYDSKSAYDRYNIRTNIDFNLTKTSKLSVDLGGQFGTRTRTNVGSMSALTQYALLAPTAASFDGESIVGATAPVTSTVYNYIAGVGYRKNHTNKLQMSAKFNQDLSFITKGLTFEASLSYDHTYYSNFTQSYTDANYYYGFFDELTNTSYNRNNLNLTVDPYTGWVYNPITGTWVENADVLQDGSDSIMSTSATTTTGVMNFNTKARLGYNRSFGKHNTAGMIVFTTNSESYHSDSYTYVPIRYVEAAARLSYNYDYRYFLEFNGGYNGSETFATENRFGFFPAVSAGWVPSNESFFPKNDVMTFLKFRGSYGETGIDAGINRFMYFDDYTINYSGEYLFGSTSLGGQGEAKQATAGNKDVVWATNFQKNIGIETKWFNDRLSINADLYRNDKKGIMMEPNLIPSVYAGEVSAGNIGEIRYEGYEIEASWQGNFNNFKYRLFANYSYANAINIDIDEVQPEYDWQVQTGRHPNQLLGLNCVGFYSQEDIAALEDNDWVGTPDAPTTTYSTIGNLQAGDLKYEDLNEDGVIDADDMMYFENTSTPKSSYGFGGNFSYKKWNVALFFQGAADVTYTYEGRIRIPFYSGVQNGANYVMGRWTQERYDAGEEITFPRMSMSGGDADHNYQDSSFWMHDASYLRLKNASISYNLTHPKLEKIGISKIGFSLSGTNLLTFTSLDIVDPETSSGQQVIVPPSRVYTLGVNVSF